MSLQNLFFEDGYKKIGFGHFSQDNFDSVERIKTQPYIKVLYIPAGYELTVDFNHYKTEVPTLFFITYQLLDIRKGNIDEASFIYYNRDFYCIQIHDKEVACDGLLFHNVFENPKVELNDSENKIIRSLFDSIKEELQSKDSSAEEMIRTYLKQIIIRATRKWKIQNLENGNLNIGHHEVDIFRNFSRYLELHYREKHHVSARCKILLVFSKN